jgi:hypothetical protein
VAAGDGAAGSITSGFGGSGLGTVEEVFEKIEFTTDFGRACGVAGGELPGAGEFPAGGDVEAIVNGALNGLEGGWFPVGGAG